MDISRKDWHYKFIMKHGHTDTRWAMRATNKKYTTCTYIRAFLYALLNASMFALSVAFFVCFVLFMAGSGVYFAFMCLSLGAIPPEPTFVLGAGLAFWLITFAGLVLYILTKLAKGITTAYEWFVGRQQVKARKKSLAKQAYEDKKNGVCTLVNFVD